MLLKIIVVIVENIVRRQNGGTPLFDRIENIAMLNRLRIEWEFIKSSIYRSSHNRDRVFKLNFGFMHVTYQGGGMFFYSYKKKGSIKTGIFSARLKFIVPALTVFLLAGFMGWMSYFLFNGALDRQMITKISGKADKGIGGLGAEYNIQNIKKLGKLELKQIEEDEKRKDALLGISNVSIVSLPASAVKKIKGSKLQKIRYRVKPGDTMSTIAHKFHVSVEAIAGSSNLRRIDTISVGQYLNIPTKEGFFYKIKKGDRLGRILTRYRVNLEKFIANNVNTNPDLLEVGDNVFLPGAKPKNIIRGWFVPVISRLITSGYGWRTWPRKSFHKGLDLKAIYAPIRSARQGIVTFRGWLGGYGRSLVISHPGGFKTLYAHLSRTYVRKGQRVGQGRIIARSGNTGYSFGPHLHFEVSHNGKLVNPRRILKGLRYSYRRRR